MSQLLQEAVTYAAKRHKYQDREGDRPLPYITHPIDVMNRLRYMAGVEDEEILCAAALHDVVEECGTPFEEIEKEFGTQVRDLVKELTRGEPPAGQIAGLSKDEIADLRSKMLLDEIRQMSPSAKLVKLADRLSNLTSYLVTRKGKKLERYVKQSKEMLKIIPRKTAPAIWDGIDELIKKG